MIDLATTTKQYLRIDEFVQLFGVSRRTVYNWRRAGRLAFIYVGQGCRIPVEEARRLMARQLDLTPQTHKLRQPGQPGVPPA